MEYFKNAHITISYDPARQLVQTRWKGFVNSEEYREILGVYLNLIKVKPVTRWLADNTHAKAIRPADQEWTAQEWVPRFSEAGGVKRMAVILSTDIFNKMAVENIVQKGGMDIAFDTHYFDNEEDALAWVMQD
ncbi:STAS/SEC14 domain-containing protein [Rufibacter sp. LB8]|uniref:STAS/SEC14 domain-containing protein n=1 Tax=Rufibacter sp. LB8 TaxID=2777781 RepID=UPI00178C38B8|nr:STAS/SEC14 domain-containing protein [Rufibacter sp. LB8]